MPRLLSLAAIVPVLFLTIPSQAADAAPTSVRNIHVLVRLQGSPLAADPFLRDRSAATRFRFRYDASLPSSRAYGASLTRYQNQESSYIRGQGVGLKTDWQFNVLFNGFGAWVPSDQLSRLRSLRNVVSVVPQRTYRPLLDRSLPLVNVPAAWNDLGGAPQAGHGVLIAQLDTGIDIKHPCFSDANMPAPAFKLRSDSPENAKLVNNKVIIARAFGGNNGQHYSAADALGHGTFGAAIEACDYNTATPLGTHVSGIAPKAWLANYNVFPGDSPGTSDSQILAALQAAELDGADVVNMSLGLPTGTGDPRLDSEMQAVGLMVKAGISVVISAGNSGPTAQSVSSPSTTPEAISVGAVSNARGIYSSITTGGAAGIPASLQRMKAKEGSHHWSGDIGPAPLVYVGLGIRPGDDSKHPNEDDFAGKDLHGKIALITRGTIFFETKINNAAKAGAIAAIVIDNVDAVNVLAMDTLTATLPAMGLTKQEGEALHAWADGHPDTAVTMHSAVSAFDETPDILTDFSSRGYGLNYGIKPDVVAPGQDIYSATESETPNNEMYDPSGFVSANGTSFSAPHVTGAVALLLQAHPKWSPAALKAALMNTAGSNVFLNPEKTQLPSVMDIGAGLINVGAAVSAPAYVLPSSLSLGAVNLAGGNGARDSKLTIADAGGGAGTWRVSVEQLHGGNGFTVSASPSIDLSQNGHADLSVHMSEAPGTPGGNYDGYIVLQKDQTTLHVPYFLHLLSQSVKPGDVLLVDASTSDYQGTPGQSTVPHIDVAPYYEKALQALGKPFTYWNEASLGPPSVENLKQSSAVIYFTGNNVNALAAGNQESLMPPLNAVDVSNLHTYLDSGGKLFITGMGAANSDGNWTAIVLGAIESSLSVYDNTNNDTNKTGGISPPKPSAEADTGVGPLRRAGIFAGLKPIDFSTGGDGAADNLAIRNKALDSIGGLIGVPGLTPLTGRFGTDAENKPADAYGQPALKMSNPANSDGGTNVGVVSSDEPNLKHTATYPGRSVLFSFGFEGINDNTGYATRQQVLQRVFAWFGDHPTARVASTQYRSKSKVQLKVSFKAQGATPAQYIWQVGNRILSASGKPTTYRFAHPGRYRLRVQITDTLGHTAVSPWTTVTVR